MGRTPRVHAGLAHISPIVRRSSRADPRGACRVSGGSLRGLKTLLRGARALDREASGRGLARRVTRGSGVYPARGRADPGGCVGKGRAMKVG